MPNFRPGTVAYPEAGQGYGGDYPGGYGGDAYSPTTPPDQPGRPPLYATPYGAPAPQVPRQRRELAAAHLGYEQRPRLRQLVLQARQPPPPASSQAAHCRQFRHLRGTDSKR